MDSVQLRYLASRKWMAAAIEDGRPVQHRWQVLNLDLESLPPELAERVEGLVDGSLEVEVRQKKRICVLDSGIDPELSFGPTEEKLTPLDQPIVDAVGLLPELPAPTDDVLEVVEAWEEWMERYKDHALTRIEGLIANPPAVGKDEGLFGGSAAWEAVTISLSEGSSADIQLDQGAEAVRDALAGKLWKWAAAREFSSESVAAANEATELTPAEALACFDVMKPARLATFFLKLTKKRYQVAKAHHVARRAKVADFDTEMATWAKKYGSERLQLGIQDGYRMNAQYLSERIAAEAPGMYAMPATAAAEGWATKATSPSEEALRLRRRIAAAMSRNAPPTVNGPLEAEIVIVKKPPHQIYLEDPGIENEDGVFGKGLPDRAGWPWHLNFSNGIVDRGPRPFEAVVVKHWLGRFHLIGAVAGRDGNGPPGIWAVPKIDLYEDDGKVTAQDPDEPAPQAAKRKPPEPAKEDDIPF